MPALSTNAACTCVQVFADGIPSRPNGLFPPDDPLLRRLAADPRCHPFEKHLPGEHSCYELLPKGGWATGDATAARGVDLRLFYKVGRPAELRPCLKPSSSRA